MKYTIRDGVEHPFSERASQSFRYILPLLVILTGVLVFALNQNHNSRQAKPVTLGIYSIKSSSKTGGGTSSAGSDNKTGGSGAAPDSPAAADTMASSMAGQSVAPVSLPGSTSTSPVTGATGGMGGGLDGGGTTDSGGTPAIPPSAPTTTVTCDNTGGLLPMTCGVCASDFMVPVGQKVLLSSSGSCTLIN